MAASLLVAFLLQGTWALAGVTGNLAGSVRGFEWRAGRRSKSAGDFTLDDADRDDGLREVTL